MKIRQAKTAIVAVIFILAAILYGIDRGQYHKPELTFEESAFDRADKDASSETAQEEETDESPETFIEKAETSEEEGTSLTALRKGIWVHVCGAVKSAGVYQLYEGQIVADAITLAGGVLPDAAGDYLNLAKPLRDGEKIIVPFLSQIKDPYGADSRDQTVFMEESLSGTLSIEGTDSGKNHLSDNAKVNINTASGEELMTLSGIGKARAEAILTWRTEHGSFKKKEDIMKVAGIKAAAYEKIRDRITV